MFNSKQRFSSSHGAGGSNSRCHLSPSQFPPSHQSESYNLHQRGEYGAYGHQQPPFIAPQSMQGGSNGGNFNMQTNGLQAFPGAPPPNTTYGPPGRDYSGPPGHGHYGPPEPEISEEEIEKEMRNLSPELQKAYNDGQKEKARLQILGKTRTAEQRTFKRLSNECKDEAKRDQQRTKLERAADQKSTSMMFDYANNNRKHPRDIDVDGDDSTEGVGRSTKKHRTSGNETEMQDENAIQEYTQFVIKQHEEQQEEMARLKVKCDKQDDELKKIRGYRVDDLKDHEAELKDIQEQHGVDMRKVESHNKEIVQSKKEIIQSKNEIIQSKEELTSLQQQMIVKYEEQIKSLKNALQEKK